MKTVSATNKQGFLCKCALKSKRLKFCFDSHVIFARVNSKWLRYLHVRRNIDADVKKKLFTLLQSAKLIDIIISIQILYSHAVGQESVPSEGQNIVAQIIPVLSPSSIACWMGTVAIVYSIVDTAPMVIKDTVHHGITAIWKWSQTNHTILLACRFQYIACRDCRSSQQRCFAV